jgi:hypothetical protein
MPQNIIPDLLFSVVFSYIILFLNDDMCGIGGHILYPYIFAAK